MKITHIVPGHSAAGSVKRALQDTDRQDDLLLCGDDLSCGPIASGLSAERVDWWKQQYDTPEFGEEIEAFWTKVDALEGKVVVWFGGYSARELAFRHAWAWHMAGRPYYILDATGRDVPFKRQDGTDGLIASAKAVGVIPASGVPSLFDSEIEASANSEEDYRQNWRRLMEENAPFRIVTNTGLMSARDDYFDQFILANSTAEWKNVARVVGDVLGSTFEPYLQTSDSTLIDRVVILVEQGRLVADSDPLEIHRCRIRIPSQ